MAGTISGIHHVTAIAGDPQRNLDFYTGILGLRLVKLTVNYDDPSTYHFYFGDGEGRPGTILTFFPWPGAPRGRRGTGQATAVAFSIPRNAAGFWIERLKASGIDATAPHRRFDEEVIPFADPDGLQLELVAHASAESRDPWSDGPVSAAHAIRGFFGVTLLEEGYERTAELHANTFGFTPSHEEGNRFRYESGGGAPGAVVDLLCLHSAPSGQVAVGTVHHVAFRTAGPKEQAAWRSKLVDLGYNVSPVIDRVYFRSIYFREPGGVLYEIATDSPGFTVDEPPDHLGSRLLLPPGLEPRRSSLEEILPPVRIPAIS
ncbi:MAG: ring-cleaving dioxygenase [Deltaproteobacteria bacterium]|nr:ring-cleaving dioxygenase [Deltaproteobacteria bacterium]